MPGGSDASPPEVTCFVRAHDNALAGRSRPVQAGRDAKVAPRDLPARPGEGTLRQVPDGGVMAELPDGGLVPLPKP